MSRWRIKSWQYQLQRNQGFHLQLVHQWIHLCLIRKETKDPLHLRLDSFSHLISFYWHNLTLPPWYVDNSLNKSFQMGKYEWFLWCFGRQSRNQGNILKGQFDKFSRSLFWQLLVNIAFNVRIWIHLDRLGRQLQLKFRKYLLQNKCEQYSCKIIFQKIFQYLQELHCLYYLKSLCVSFQPISRPCLSQQASSSRDVLCKKHEHMLF